MSDTQQGQDALDQHDQSSSKFKKIASLCVVVFLVFGLAAFGLSDFLGIRTDFVIRVEDKKITPTAFSKFVDAQKKQYISRFGSGIIEGFLNTKEFVSIVAGMMVDQLLIEKALEDAGVFIDKDTINTYVNNLPTFKKLDGTFDRNLYNAYLNQIGMKEEDFIIDQIPQIQTKFFTEIIDMINLLNQAELAKELILSERQTREVEFIKVPIVPVQSSFLDEEIMNYYLKHKENFTKEEERKVNFVKLDGSLLQNTKLSNAELLKEYNRQYLYKNQRINFYKLSFPTMEEAKHVQSLIHEGLSLTDIAKEKLGMKASDIYFGNVPFEELSFEFSEEIITLKLREISNIFFANNSYNIVKMDSFTNKSAPSFESVKSKIASNAGKFNSCSALEKVVNNISSDVESGESLDVAIKNLAKVETAVISSKGSTILPENIKKSILEDTDTHYAKVLNARPCQYYAYQIAEVIPKSYLDMELVKPQIIAQLSLMKAESAAFENANKEYEKIGNSKEKISETATLSRKDEKIMPKVMLDTIFTAKEGDITIPIISNDKKFYIVAKLWKIVNITEKDISVSDLNKTIKTLKEIQKDELLRIMLSNLRQKYKVQINHSAF